MKGSVKMCGICGYVNYSKLVENINEIVTMNETLKKRGPDSQNVYIDNNTALGHSRLSIIDVHNGIQPMIKKHFENEYVIVYNGEIYNSNEIRDDLVSKGYSFVSHCDTEVVLTAYIEYKEKIVKYLNGIFAFAIYDKLDNSVFLCRDHLGIKPLFYTLTENNTYVFASEIKAILANSNTKAILDKQGILELFGLGPAHSPGYTYFKNIFELKAGHYAKITSSFMAITKYWDLKTKSVNISETDAIEQVAYLVNDATKRQLVSDVGICSMLSGGIDSSILSTIANNNLEKLDTFSIDFKGNDQNFVANDYQISRDSDYIEIMRSFLNTNHHNIYFDNIKLYELLKDSMIARDMPGMADIDSSMYAFCESIHRKRI
jgi:asparagine synthase (glutamine-hydrolysing)